MTPKRLASAIILTVFAALAAAYLTACSWTPDKRAAVAASLWVDAKAILKDAALKTIANVVQDAANGGKIDFAHAAAGALYGEISAANVRQVVLDATGGALPKLADAAQAVVLAQVKDGTGEQVAIRAVADAITAKAMTATPTKPATP